jgi:hypothetical protein
MRIIRILSCDDPCKWYNDAIGERRMVLGEEETEYKTRDNDGHINFVSKCDVEVVDYVGLRI